MKRVGMHRDSLALTTIKVVHANLFAHLCYRIAIERLGMETRKAVWTPSNQQTSTRDNGRRSFYVD